jgi:AcrR family transcriptional regulator
MRCGATFPLFFTGMKGQNPRIDSRSTRQGMSKMDMELSGAQPQLQQAGRGDRVARTREAIVSSTLTLAMEGEVAPIVRDIAKLAGVSARTVFQHFADTAELYVAVLGRVLTSLRGDAQPAAATGALDERISEVIGQRAGRYEKLLPMWTFVETLQHRSSAAGEQVTQMYTTNREQLAECFGQELTTLGENRERTLNALAMALTPESWIVLRDRLGLTVEQARDEWRFIVKAIFNGR